MEELAKLEAERGNPEYMDTGEGKRRHLQMDLQPGGSYGKDGTVGKEKAAVRIVGSESREKHGRQDRSRRASNEMCTFLILNVSSFQLIPVNMIAYRSQYGSANPAAILGPAMIATFFSTLAGIVFAKFMYALPEQKKGGNSH